MKIIGREPHTKDESQRMWRVRDEGLSRDEAKVREAVGHHPLSRCGIELRGRHAL